MIKRSWVQIPKGAGLLFSFHLLEICPWTGPLRKCITTDFPFKSMHRCPYRGEPSSMCTEWRRNKLCVRNFRKFFYNIGSRTRSNLKRQICCNNQTRSNTLKHVFVSYLNIFVAAAAAAVEIAAIVIYGLVLILNLLTRLDSISTSEFWMKSNEWRILE